MLENDDAPQLFVALTRIAQLQGDAIDRLALNEVVIENCKVSKAPSVRIKEISALLHARKPVYLSRPDPAAVPALIHDDTNGWGILRGMNAKGDWVLERINPVNGARTEYVTSELGEALLVQVSLARPFRLGDSPVFRLIQEEFLAHSRLLVEALIGGIFINLVALAASLYSMQVYDRVVPTGSSQTLIVLSIGVMLAIVFEYAAKQARSRIFEEISDLVDQRISRAIYTRFLAIRLDQLPQSVGSLASQLRGYETVRAFLTSSVAHLMVDVPFGLVFVILIGIVGNWKIAVIPAVFLMLTVVIGLYHRRRIDIFAGKANAVANMKTGLLVESIEGAETIKSGGGGWRMLSRWMHTNDEARDHELRMKDISEHAQHITALFQQLAYALLVAAGALSVSQGELTMGALIACSILSGRALAPGVIMSGQLVAWGYAKAALQSLDRIWLLQDDHDGIERPIAPDTLHGAYRVEGLQLSYGASSVPALNIPQLTICAGEKVGILGPVGGGKTTLLRALSGMYRPQAGRVMLDGVDIAHVSKPVLSEKLGYLQQDGRLFAGTLRENLILGMIDPGDAEILDVARKTGLLDAVISKHPKGLMLPIAEGGSGLSGGQRQLVNLTRQILRRPNIWLLDEPTASMDKLLEAHITHLLAQTLAPEDTLILVTHKSEMLALVDRLIVVANNRVIIDGPKATVLDRLKNQVAAFVGTNSSTKLTGTR